jgi:hypothetical protein
MWRCSSSNVTSDEKNPFLSDERTKETRSEKKSRIRTNAMAIGVLKLLDKGIRPLLDVHNHGIR